MATCLDNVFDEIIKKAHKSVITEEKKNGITTTIKISADRISTTTVEIKYTASGSFEINEGSKFGISGETNFTLGGEDDIDDHEIEEFVKQLEQELHQFYYEKAVEMIEEHEKYGIGNA